MVIVFSCAKGPDPWSPKTYSAELERYQRDPSSLPRTWTRNYVKGQKDESFFYFNEDLRASIIITFTCGKYADIDLQILAEHPRFPMGRSAKVIHEGYVPDGRVDVYHVVARGLVEYDEPKEKKGRGPQEEMIMDYYVVGEPHCVVDVVYLVPPENYERGLSDFHACLKDLGILVE